MATPAEQKKDSAKKPKIQVVYDEADARTLVDWTPANVKAAEAMADRGDLRMAADLVELMLTDDRMMGATEALCSVVSLPLSFDPPESPVSLALDGRSGDWWQMFPEPELKKLIKWGRVLGVGLGYIRGWFRHPESGRMVCDLEVWHPRNLRWDARRKKWFVRVLDGPEVEVTPGDGTWVLYIPYGKKRPWADAPWRGLARWWLLKRYAQHDWAYYSERQGNGTEVIEEKPAEQNATPLEEDAEFAAARRKELVSDLRKLARNAKIVLPAGYTYKFVESISRTWETFVKQKECADTAMAIATVGQNLSTEIKGGSLAAAEVHSKVEWRIIRDVAESVVTMIRAQVLPFYVLYNFAREIAPWPVFDTNPPEDLKAKTEALDKFATSLQKFNVAGYDVENVEELALKYGVQLKKRETPPPGKPGTKDQDAVADAA